MAWMECDACKGHNYTDDNPFIEIRRQRPSDHADMCCIMAGHNNCVGTRDVSRLPAIGPTGGTATHEQWEHWIEGEGMQNGFLWIS